MSIVSTGCTQWERIGTYTAGRDTYSRSAPRQLMGTKGNRHLQHGWHISYSSEYASVEMGSGYY